jgi:hypothetical protein
MAISEPRVKRDGIYVCPTCDEEVPARKGDPVPECPNGHGSCEEQLEA